MRVTESAQHAVTQAKREDVYLHLGARRDDPPRG
jgi:hypothetical protein